LLKAVGKLEGLKGKYHSGTKTQKPETLRI
jgi:hypothetical protein